MRSLVFRSIFFSILIGLLFYPINNYFDIVQFRNDVDGLSAFLGVFGTLYGILAAFIVFEVWTQYNQISQLIDREAQGIERLFRLALYFRDETLTKQMRTAIEEYVKRVVDGRFQAIGLGGRNKRSGPSFRKIAEIIRHIEFDDDHDSIVFDQILEHYGHLGQIRTERLNQSLTRMPSLLKAFVYISSFFALIVFLFMPFDNLNYGAFSVMIIAFLEIMIFYIIEDLDNPFQGHWKLTPKPFSMALKHIREDY